MANWLSAAAQAFQRTPPQPQFYELRCGCGRLLQGIRTANYQQLTCPACKRQLFVLPFTIYPAPKSRPVSKPKPSPRKETVPANPDDIEDFDSPDHDSVNSAPVATPEKIAAPPAKPRRPKPAALPETVARKPDLARRLPRPLFTPLRGVFVGIVVVLCLSSWWIVHTRAVQTADVAYLAASRRAREALAEHKLPAASDLDAAYAALQISGRTDPPARAIRQLYYEIHAATNLVDGAPGDLLEEAVKTHATSPDDGWQEVFQFSYRDKWLILDVEVTRTAASPKSRRYRIDYPISVGNNRAAFVADLPIFDKFVDLPDRQRIIFAAQIEDFRTDSKNPGIWEIVLKPQTACLWSNLQNYQLLGLTGDLPDAESRKVLTEQTQMLGLPIWEAPPETASIAEVPQ